MADIKFSQFTNTPTPNANAFFVGYNSTTGINSRTTLTDLITAIGAPSGSGTANFVSKWSGTNTLTDSLFFSDAIVAKTIYNSQDFGLYIDFDYPSVRLTNVQGIGFHSIGNETFIGDKDNNIEGTQIYINNIDNIIKTSSQNSDKGLKLDFANDVYTLGVNSTNCFEVTNSIKRTIFNNGTSGLYLEGNSYYLGYYVNNTDPSGGMYGLYLENTYAGLGDKNNNLNGLNLIVDWNDEATKIKSTYVGQDKGIILDFTNNFYLFGNADNVPNQLAISGNELILGDVFNNVNSTKFIVDDSVQIIKSSAVGQDKGLLLDFAYLTYQLGDWNGNNNGTTFLVDDTNGFIKTYYNGQQGGLYIDFANNDVYLNNNIDMGLLASGNTLFLGDWNGNNNATVVEIRDNDLRILLQSSRTWFQPKTTTEINALTATAFEGDVVYNSTLHKLCFYNGTSWQQVTSIPM